MRLAPKELAGAIARYADPPISESAWGQLALALSRGEGVARDGHRLYVVLQSPWQATSPGDRSFRPTLLSCEKPLGSARRLRSTRAVVATFVTEATGRRPRGKGQYAPATPFGARVSLAGQCLANAGTTTTQHLGATITWYNLHLAPVGSLVYRVREDGSVLLYQCIRENGWMVLHLDGKRDVVNLPQVLHEVCRMYDEDIEGLEVLEGPPTLLREPS